MGNPQLTAAYKRMKPQFPVHPPYGAVIADINMYAASDYSEPIRDLAEAHPEAMYLTTELNRRVSRFPNKTAEALFAFILGHEFHHFLERQGALPEELVRLARKHRLRTLHSDRLEQMADSFGIVAARKAGYSPKTADIKKILCA